jgi:hypothetical protein
LTRGAWRSTSIASSAQQMTVPVLVCLHSCLCLGHFAWLTPWQLRLKCSVRRTKDKTSVGGIHSLKSKPKHFGRREPAVRRVHPCAASVVARGRPAPTMDLVPAAAIKGPRREVVNLWRGLIRLWWQHLPRDIGQPNAYRMRIAGEIVKYGCRRTPNTGAINQAGVEATSKLKRAAPIVLYLPHAHH